ncbi:kinase-like domain-containing protein [Morchella snyderi]|nr:kinase-like domain-containing protein [Morchella snyderi]
MAMSAASATDRALRVRENSEKAVRKEMTGVPPDVPYTVLELVGKGSFGSVYKGIHNETKQIVAVKSLDLDQHDDEIKDIQKEIALLSQLKAGDAPNITAFHGSYLLGHRLWVIIDFCSGGSVRTLMKAGPIDEKYITIIVRETLTALGYLHKQGIIHRDIKAANILVGQDGRVQLCDFGVSAQLAGKNGKRNTFVGTPQWMAPEALTGGSYDSRIDIWSFGITIIEMAKQNPPLFNIPPNRVVDMIPRLPPPRLEGGTWSNPLREFVALCLNEVPEERATVDELLRSRFVKGSKGLPSSLMRELIVRYEAWASRGGVRDSMWQAALQSDMDQLNATLASEPGWDFDTVKSRLSGVSEYIKQEMSGAGGSNSNVSTLKAAPVPAPYRGPSEAARQRAAEGLVRLFQSPQEEAAAAAAAAIQKPTPGNLGYDSSFRSSDASSRSTTPENKVSMISIPTFDDNGLRVPEKRATSPNTSATKQQQQQPIAPTSTTPTPPPPIVRIRRNRADSAGASMHHRPNNNSPTPPTPIDDRAVSPSPSPFSTPTPTPTPAPRRPATAASAPSSPPRSSSHHYAPPPPPPAHPQLGLKSHHLPSKSAPNIAVLRDGGGAAPPLPTIAPTPPLPGGGGGLRLASAVPHGKSRSADITRGRPAGGRPGNLNLDLPAAAGMLPPSPGRPWGGAVGGGGGGGMGGGGMGGGVFPVIEPLDVGVLPLDGGDARMWEELDRVLGGLGDALEVVQKQKKEKKKKSKKKRQTKTKQNETEQNGGRGAGETDVHGILIYIHAHAHLGWAGSEAWELSSTIHSWAGGGGGRVVYKISQSVYVFMFMDKYRGQHLDFN